MSTASEQRRALMDLAALAKRDLFAFWTSLAGLSAEGTRDALSAALPEIGAAYGAAAATLAADWYDDLRAESGVKGSFTADPAPEVDPQRWDALARWGVSPLFGAEPNPGAALTLIEGGLQRSVADQHRLTIVESTWHDPRSQGWRRIGQGDNCKFCQMLIGRGAVYRDDTVTFKSHDHCNCTASPTWDASKSVDTVPYRASKRNLTAADKARTKEYLDGQSEPKKPSGFAAMSRAQLEKQLTLTEGLKDSEWRTAQLARLRKRLAELD